MAEREYRGAIERIAAQRAADEGQAPIDKQQTHPAARPWSEVFAEVAPNGETRPAPTPSAAIAKGWSDAIGKVGQAR